MDGASNTDEVVAATFKVLVLGDSNVGKSSLIKTYCTKTRPSGNTVPTIGVDFTDTVVDVRGTKVKLRIWDTAGQEKFHTFTKQFFRGTQGIMLVYDITDMNSFRTLQKWNSTLDEAGVTDVDTVIIGNKQDLEELRVVPKETAEQFATLNYKTRCIETSVYSGKNVMKAFHMLAENLIFSHNIFQPGREATVTDDTCNTLHFTNKSVLTQGTSQSFKLDQVPTYSNRKKCCLST